MLHFVLRLLDEVVLLRVVVLLVLAQDLLDEVFLRRGLVFDFLLFLVVQQGLQLAFEQFVFLGTLRAMVMLRGVLQRVSLLLQGLRLAFLLVWPVFGREASALRPGRVQVQHLGAVFASLLGLSLGALVSLLQSLELLQVLRCEEVDAFVLLFLVEVLNGLFLLGHLTGGLAPLLMRALAVLHGEHLRLDQVLLFQLLDLLEGALVVLDLGLAHDLVQLVVSYSLLPNVFDLLANRCSTKFASSSP